MKSRYPKGWKSIALEVKEKAGWQCAKCRRQCIKPDDDLSGLTVSERVARTLQVHHQDYQPENNDPSNLSALCSGCHLEKHQGQRGNVSPGQLLLAFKASQ